MSSEFSSASGMGYGIKISEVDFFHKGKLGLIRELIGIKLCMMVILNLTNQLVVMYLVEFMNTSSINLQ